MIYTEFKVDDLNECSCIVYAHRALDNSNADVFSSLIMDMYAKEKRHIVIDMSELEFLSSAGIGSILGTVELFRERKGDIVLTNVDEKITHILDVLDISEYLTICNSKEDAMALCGN